MKFGVSLSGFAQQPPGADIGQTFREILEYVRTARDLGFDFIYQGQQYLTGPIQQLQTMPLLARASAEADGMGIVATLLIPLYHPVDLAERVTTMDILSGGRFVLSAALGFRDEEFNAFAVYRGARISRYLETLEVMKRLWTQEEVTFNGKHFQLEGARAEPKPIQKPHPPIWVAAHSDRAVRRAARLGYTWYVHPNGTYDTISRQIELYHHTAREAGTPVASTLPLMREVYVHENRDTAFEESRPYLEGKYRSYAAWGQDAAMPQEESFRGSYEELAKDRFIVGTPDDCIRELERYAALGMSHGSFRMMWPGMGLEKGMRCMELFSRSVMPHFTRE